MLINLTDSSVRNLGLVINRRSFRKIDYIIMACSSQHVPLTDRSSPDSAETSGDPQVSVYSLFIMHARFYLANTVAL